MAAVSLFWDTNMAAMTSCETHNTSIFITYNANELEIMLFIILSILTVPMSGKKKSSSAACLVSMRVAGSRRRIFANRSGLLGYLFSTYCLREQWAFSCSLSTCLGFFKLEQSAKIKKKNWKIDIIYWQQSQCRIISRISVLCRLLWGKTIY